MKELNQDKKPKVRFWMMAVVITFSVMLSSFGFYFWQMVNSPNILIGDDTKERYIYIYSGMTYEELVEKLYKSEIVYDELSFRFVAKWMKYPEQVKAGRYLLKPNMNNRETLLMLRKGEQKPLNVTLSNARVKSEIAKVLTDDIEAQSDKLLDLLSSQEVAEKYGFDTTNFAAMFIPNTYQFFWNTSEQQLLDRMKVEYDKFWTDERKKKAAAIGLSPIEVSILASIVDSETNYEPEKPTVAGLYLNRIKRGWKLESDPTVKFALKKFEIRRVLNEHLEVESPYNTYKVMGLPPGPICLPSISGIDAVLNYEEHKYMFMCANVEKPGHAFARNGGEHARNAAAYRRWLNQQKIYR